MNENTDEKKLNETPQLTEEEKAKIQEEKVRQDKLISSLKSKEQIEKETQAALKTTVDPKGAAVAAALLNSIPVKKEKEQTGPIVVRTFEVVLYEEDEDDRTGQMIQKIVNNGKPEIIQASSPEELNEKLSLYRQCGQTYKIKEVGEPKFFDRKTGQPINRDDAIQVQEQPVRNQQQLQPVVQQQKKPVKYYKIGGIDVKDDNGKIYQKQWMKLSENEANNIRIINDKTNAIVNMNNKHIEMMKWIPVQNSEQDEITALEEQISE